MSDYQPFRLRMRDHAVRLTILAHAMSEALRIAASDEEMRQLDPIKCKLLELMDEMQNLLSRLEEEE